MKRDLIDRKNAIREGLEQMTFLERIGKLIHTTSEVKAWFADFMDALPSADVPVINVGDTISRRAAIDALYGITAQKNFIPLDSAVFNINKLPSVEPDSYGHYPKMEQTVPPADPQMSQVAREIAQIIINERTMRELLKPQRWIPVTERLPEVGKFVLVTDPYLNDVDIMCKAEDSGWEDRYQNWSSFECVSAWCELPEPYKGGAE